MDEFPDKKYSSDKEKENKKMKKMRRIEIAQYIALGATCLTVLGFVLSGIFGGRIPMSMMGLWQVLFPTSSEGLELR